MPGELQGWRAVALIAVAVGLAAASFLLPWPGGGDDDELVDVPTRGCAHAREEPAHDLRQAERATLCLLNAERRRRGLRPLRSDPRLRVAALRHSRDMADRRYLEHVSPEGTDHAVRIARAGYPLTERSLSGENLATGEREAAAPAVIVDGWMNSPGHRRNILRPEFREIGIGIVPRSDAGEPGGTYATEFAGRL